MAIDIETVYPGGVDPATADYPYGVPRDVSAPSAGDGTPWAVAFIKDWSGFFQGLLSRSGIVPSGNPDTVLISDYADALDTLYALPMLSQRDGLLTTWDSTVLLSTSAGKVRNQANTRWLTLAASMQKDVSAVWAPGTGLGGLADTVVLAEGHHRKFLVNKADFSGADIVWDLDVAAANFFASAAAVSAGYTDATLYRRVGYSFVDSGLVFPKHFHSAADLHTYTWDIGFAFSPIVIGVGPRTAVVINAPPNTLATGQFEIQFAISGFILITTLAQSDSVPIVSNRTYVPEPPGSIQQIDTVFEVDSGSQIYIRADTVGNTFVPHERGWIDNLLIP